MILLIDNYDSFVHNLARYFMLQGEKTLVVRNDQLSLDKISALKPSAIVLSPGPYAPDQAGICLAVVDHFYRQLPMLGVCLGHQVIGQYFGGKIVMAKRPMHGESSIITHSQEGIFEDCAPTLSVGRYHSLVVEPLGFEQHCKVTAWSSEQEVMSIAHHSLPVFGVQFHPESILTDEGEKIVANFLKYARMYR